MPLQLRLKPHERVILGGAVIQNGETRTEFLVENEVPVLRETDILAPRSVSTPCDRIYMALQLMYVDPSQAQQHDATLRSLVDDVAKAAPSTAPLLEEMLRLAGTGRIYKALKVAKTLRCKEKELIDDVS